MVEKCIIIGLGQIGMGYDFVNVSDSVIYTHAKALSLHTAFDLIGGVDTSKEQRCLFEEHYGLQSYSSIADALEENIASVVVIASPTANHCLAIKEVLKYSNPKAILCEKPLAYELSEAYEIVESCENAGVKLFVNYMRRADPVAVRKDDVSAAIHAAKANVAGLGSISGCGGFIQTTSG